MQESKKLLQSLEQEKTIYMKKMQTLGCKKMKLKHQLETSSKETQIIQLQVGDITPILHILLMCKL